MKEKESDMILVNATNTVLTRKRAPVELEVDTLAGNMNLFLTQIETLIEKSPDDVGKFKFTEFTVSAEVSADGKLILAGSGIEAGAKGGLTFKFEKV